MTQHDILKQRIMITLESGLKFKQKILAAHFCVTERWIRKVIRELREEGHMICSGNDGYWISKNHDDIQHTLNRLYSQHVSHLDLLIVMGGFEKEYEYGVKHGK